MSRTYRNLPLSCGCYRRIRHIRQKRLSIAALQDLLDNGYQPTNRLKIKANPASGENVSDWDDLVASSYYQLDYKADN